MPLQPNLCLSLLLLRLYLPFDDLEQKGVFRILASTIEVMKKIGETYTAEDMEQIGDGLVILLGVAKKLTTPEAIDLLEKTVELPAKVDLSQAKSTGAFGMLWAMGNKEVQEGLGVLLQLTKGLATLKG